MWGSQRICREAVAACGWAVTGRGASTPQVAGRQVVPGRQRLGSSRRDLLTPNLRLGDFSLTFVFIPLGSRHRNFSVGITALSISMASHISSSIARSSLGSVSGFMEEDSLIHRDFHVDVHSKGG